MKPRSSPLASILAVVALAVMAGAYFTPIWWVSLTAPNYPKDRFPDGIRIHFGFDGVSNGCTTPPKTSRAAQETQQEDLGWRSEEGGGVEEKKPSADGGLDCVHEMNTINHYVGMRPIGVGAPVERLLGRFILAMFAVMLLAFALRDRKARVGALAAGFLGVTAWMVVDLFVAGQLAAHVAAYKEDAGKYFREVDRINAWGETLHSAVVVVVLVLVAVMVFTVVATWKWAAFELLLGGIPALLPLFFVGAYAAWLWFFGHNMHPWGAFTLKPFMPTVFGDGMVAQFTTHSYPHYGFGLLALSSVLLLVAVARRRLELSDGKDA